jgi:hypothetical protein
LSGILKADVRLNSLCNQWRKVQYENINSAGTMGLSGFQYADENGKTMNISTAVVQFNPSQSQLRFKCNYWKSDIGDWSFRKFLYGLFLEIRG